jgi:hypothetical protein
MSRLRRLSANTRVKKLIRVENINVKIFAETVMVMIAVQKRLITNSQYVVIPPQRRKSVPNIYRGTAHTSCISRELAVMISKRNATKVKAK